ncbi:undecaprenyldiphospho-muramoylpentapeptide beta-N-acetylglucosaminyltransferase [Lederbergia lenta]|uniref:UDP-N-acetylglucosamine--N-acetylmuramyl-(pentapeptide) pyrophosphoryl-undecaprenol N-acetylglucosamine transferase n=1 Tax=Lederbergia lenta TaxID=1467 RepID=A0A2X4WCQ0_LEDLE|nr:undecaprenyldiphospho-muramoylpentapeptide beta-N-acetylglucosaminyltransferase [Lederbergia lenta]MCM3110236.1 undecaprenyldiphospho-muramoylpentapeptide beta-N-acetylglucosaminyltransferase [Lederbergia lenta]MEC2324196.1 undecaprenyldiphospho-muramoylpentapeptide beta-N-acetylglucosaminyltransferase [Lederbergia lenta]SQI60499.1 UDP-N-acetylglucosamine--N-acetylmuramyl-(pentapeptide) pyrophosphoryl-undecaprenol N-acetylglucosamine transferase [Lederbergia lenta]
MKIIVSGGGTGGHIYPALALIRTIKEEYPETEFLYIGTEKGLEADIIRRENIPFATINITGFKRSLSFENIKTIFRFLKGVTDSKKLLKEFKPDAVIGTGGYVCGPVVYAAAKKKIPTIIHEQNSIPGLTNKFLSRYVDKVAICFEQVREYFPENKVVFTGNPRASEVIGKKNNELIQSFGLKDYLPIALIFGGSRGARPINEVVIKSLSQLSKKPYQILYVTGEAHYDEVQIEAELLGQFDNVVIVPFIHNMQELLASIDVVIGRAGATSIAEITALGLPSILIPSPYVTNNHQEKNAEALVEKGAAYMLTEKELTSQRLITALDALLLDEVERTNMGNASKKLGIQDASNRLFDVIKALQKND